MWTWRSPLHHFPGNLSRGSVTVADACPSTLRRTTAYPGPRATLISSGPRGTSIFHAPTVGDDRANLREPAIAGLPHKQEKVAGPSGGDPREPRSVRRPARLDVHRSARRQRRHRAAPDIEQHQLHRPAVVPDKSNEPSIGRPVGLVVGAVGIGELLRP